MDEQIKDSFSKVKQDILFLGQEISSIRQEILDLKSDIRAFSDFANEIKLKEIASSAIPEYDKQIEQNNQQQELNLILREIQELRSELKELKELKISEIQTPAHPTQTPTYNSIPTDTSAHPHEIGGLISPKTAISTGNEGVPTDRQTNQQTDQHIIQQINVVDKPNIDQLEKASEILASLDSLKKEVRLKFKRLTSQEMQVFSMLYSLEDQGIIVDYSLLSTKLQLSESSIRDYISKVQKKGIPIIKEKLNNKKVIIHISSDLKKIASLNTILSLRSI